MQKKKSSIPAVSPGQTSVQGEGRGAPSEGKPLTRVGQSSKKTRHTQRSTANLQKVWGAGRARTDWRKKQRGLVTKSTSKAEVKTRAER